MMVLIIHTGIVWFLIKAEDGWLNIGWKGDKGDDLFKAFCKDIL